MFCGKLITCWTDTVPLVLGSPGGLELLIPDVVVLGTPSRDEYRATLDDGNVAVDKGLPGVMVIASHRRSPIVFLMSTSYAHISVGCPSISRAYILGQNMLEEYRTIQRDVCWSVNGARRGVNAVRM